MTIYIVILVVLGFFSAVVGLNPGGAVGRSRVQVAFSSLVGLMLILILAFRGTSVGVDVKQYLVYWSLAETNDLSEISRFQPAFLRLIEISRSLSESPHFFLLLVAVLSIAPVAYAVHQGSPQPLLSWTLFICLGFYAFTFSGLRQAIALALTTAAIQFIRKRKLVTFLLLIALAWSFHASALIFLPAYWIYRIRLRRINVIIYFILLPIIFLFREQIFLWFTLAFYSSYEIIYSQAYTWLLISVAILALAWLLLVRARKGTVKAETKADAEGLLKIATVGVTLMLFASVGNNVMRMTDYYFMAIVLALPTVFEIVSNKVRVPVKIYLVSGLIGIYSVQMMQSPYAIVPYTLFTD